MSYEENATDTRIAKNHKENLPESSSRLVQLVGKHFEEGYVQECSTSNTLKNPIAYFLGQGRW